MKQVAPHILRRVYALFGVFLFIAVLIVLRILVLQWNKDHWLAMEQVEKVFIKKVVADRGSIYAADGTILAASVPFYRLAMDPTIIDTTHWVNFSDSLHVLSQLLVQQFEEPENDSVAEVLARGYYDQVITAMAENDRHIYLSLDKVNFQELERIQTWPILNRGRWESGFVVEKFNNERYYPFQDLARITLGTMVDDTMGLRGLEHSFNRELRGQDGYILAQKVAGGSYVPLDQYGQEAAQDGYDIHTTLDLALQEIVEEALRDGVEYNHAKYGTAILMEVTTGKIKALANYPEGFNHAIATQIEPGSTFKLASAAALMEDALYDYCDTIDTGDGRIMYDDKEVTDNGIAYGRIPLEDVIAYSSNVGISKAVYESYDSIPEQFLAHLRRFGFYEPANNQIAGEPTPKVFDPESPEWTMATLPSMSYGYSIGVTPIQMAAFYNGIANKGKRLRPYLVEEIRDNSRVVQRFGTEVLEEEMVSPQTALLVRDMMMGVVEYGTASRQFRNMPFMVAGKTGTARKIRDGRYVKEYRASFGGFFPADNPRYTLYIMVDEPRGNAASGGQVAAPIFREIAERVYAMDQELLQPPALPERVDTLTPPAVPVMYASVAADRFPELPLRDTLNQDQNLSAVRWVVWEEDSLGHYFRPLHLENKAIPDLRGMNGRDALNLLENMGLRVRLRGVGTVRRQSLLPGHKAGEGTEITLFLG